MSKLVTSLMGVGIVSLSLAACAGEASNLEKEAANDVKAVEKKLDPVARMSQATDSKAAIKTYDQAYSAMREVRAARLAIFDGEGEAAAQLVKTAQTNLGAAQADFEKVAKAETGKAGVKVGYLPFDLSIALAEQFDAKPAKKEAVQKANEHLSKGERDKAVETLRLADVNIETAAALLPYQTARGQLDEAGKLIGEGKFYEANLALKKIEDSVVIQVFDIDGKPKIATAKGTGSKAPSG